MEQADSNQPEMLGASHLDKSGRYGKRRGPEVLRLRLGLADSSRPSPSGRDSFPSCSTMAGRQKPD